MRVVNMTPALNILSRQGKIKMFEVKLYNNNSDLNVVDKILTNETIFNCTARQTINILSPEIILEGQNINDFNYAFIPILRRYYYITDISMVKINVFALKLHVDVLKTYSVDIRNSKGAIIKQIEHNPYFGDYDVESRKEIERLDFENPFDKNGTIIMVALKG